MRKTLGVIRVQLKLENQVSLFNDLICSKNVDLIKRELKKFNPSKMESIVDPLMGLSGRKRKVKNEHYC